MNNKKPITEDSITKLPELSVIVPCFNEEENLDELYRHLVPVLENTGMNWEVILTDDGSRDATWQRISELSRMEPRIRGIRLSRNFGHQYALYAGLQASRGAAVVSMDADLQHPPEFIPRLIEEWRNGYKIVNTIRIDPPDFGPLKRLSARLYYALFSFLSGVKIQHGMADFRLLDRSVVEQLNDFHEEGLFLRGLVQWVGFNTTAVEFECGSRFAGQSKYSLRRMFRFAWHGVTSFSIVPLRLGIITGLITSVLAFAYLVRALYVNLVAGTTVPGWTSTVAILSFLFGVLFIFLGVLGEYVGRILVQVRDRPLYIVAEKTGPE